MGSKKNLSFKEFLINGENRAKNLIAQGDGLVKVIGGVDKDWTFILEQINDPQNQRPKPIGSEIFDKDDLRFNPKTRELYQKNPKNPSKQHTHTKKTATSLLPGVSNDGQFGQMDLFGTEYGTGIGLLFDIQECDLKDEKYLFEKEANTFGMWWKGVETDRNKESRQKNNSIPLIELKKLLKENAEKALNENRTLEYSELLVGLNKAGLKAIVFQQNTQPLDQTQVKTKEITLEFFKVILKQKLVAEKLGKYVPILQILPSFNVAEYTFEQQCLDVANYDQNYKNNASDDELALLEKVKQYMIELTENNDKFRHSVRMSQRISQVLLPTTDLIVPSSVGDKSSSNSSVSSSSDDDSDDNSPWDSDDESSNDSSQINQEHSVSPIEKLKTKIGSAIAIGFVAGAAMGLVGGAVVGGLMGSSVGFFTGLGAGSIPGLVAGVIGGAFVCSVALGMVGGICGLIGGAVIGLAEMIYNRNSAAKTDNKPTKKTSISNIYNNGPLAAKERQITTKQLVVEKTNTARPVGSNGQNIQYPVSKNDFTTVSNNTVPEQKKLKK